MRGAFAATSQYTAQCGKLPILVAISPGGRRTLFRKALDSTLCARWAVASEEQCRCDCRIARNRETLADTGSNEAVYGYAGNDSNSPIGTDSTAKVGAGVGGTYNLGPENRNYGLCGAEKMT